MWSFRYLTLVLLLFYNTVEHSYNKPGIPCQTVRYKQEFVISEQFPMRYCSTWLRSLLCYIKKFVIEEFVIRVLHCIILCGNGSVHVGCDSTHPLICSKDRGFQSPWTSPRGGTSWRCLTHIFSCPISVQLVRRGNIARFNPSYCVSLSI